MDDNEFFVVALDGLSASRMLETLPDRALRNMARAINYAARTGAADSRRKIRSQVEFPASYLTGSSAKGQRFGVDRQARADNLVASITARWRPTSLARFVTGPAGRGRRGGTTGVQVEVHPGVLKTVQGAFLLRVRGVNGLTDMANGNQALAIRTKDGAPPRNAWKPAKLSRGLYLLYGPSVSQVFKSVRQDEGDLISEKIETEFARLMNAGIS